MDIAAHNRDAWNRESRDGSRWCQPVDGVTVQAARSGEWEVHLTPNRPVPRGWFGDLTGARVLCLASGGGQQAPVLAAAGASVVSFDNSDEQLAKDAMVAEREGLDLTTVRGDMVNDLAAFEADSFDLIFHPASNVFVEDIRPVWRECHRVLRAGGRLLSGFMNPAYFLFDHEDAEATGKLEVKFSLPYSDLENRAPAQVEKMARDGQALEFGHTLEDQIGGQCDAGFVIAGLLEDDWEDEATPLNRFTSTLIATLARKAGVDPARESG